MNCELHFILFLHPDVILSVRVLWLHRTLDTWDRGAPYKGVCLSSLLAFASPSGFMRAAKRGEARGRRKDHEEDTWP